MKQGSLFLIGVLIVPVAPRSTWCRRRNRPCSSLRSCAACISSARNVVSRRSGAFRRKVLALWMSIGFNTPVRPKVRSMSRLMVRKELCAPGGRHNHPLSTHLAHAAICIREVIPWELHPLQSPTLLLNLFSNRLKPKFFKRLAHPASKTRRRRILPRTLPLPIPPTPPRPWPT